MKIAVLGEDGRLLDEWSGLTAEQVALSPTVYLGWIHRTMEQHERSLSNEYSGESGVVEVPRAGPAAGVDTGQPRGSFGHCDAEVPPGPAPKDGWSRYPGYSA